MAATSASSDTTQLVNNAAWFTKAGSSLEVKSSSITSAGPNQIVIKARAIAVNPVDWMTTYVPFIFSHLKVPVVLGFDVAGEVIEIGSDVTRFKVGDRVLGNAVGPDKRSNKSSEGAFQEYVVLRENLASAIPDSMRYEDACVLPLGLSTAACGFYQKGYLEITPPTINPTSSGEVVIVWGASTSVGSNAVQLARASGYEVIATASPKNWEYVKKLGAATMFDYRSKSVVQDIGAALRGKRCAGAIAIGDGSTESCVDIISKADGKKLVIEMSKPLASSDLTTGMGKVKGFAAVARYTAAMSLKAWRNGVEVKFVFGTDLMENEVGDLIYRDFLPQALAKNQYLAAPSPVVVGNGLGKIQEALDIYRKGMSAGKAVVTLS